jgi:hypothetical protein
MTTPETPVERATEVAPSPALPLKLWAAVLQAQRTIETVEKGKTAEVVTKSGSKYTYKFASTEDMMQAARDALLANGVMAQRTDYRVEASYGREAPPPLVHSFFRLVHPESGEVEVFPPLAMPITAHNAPDKALAGALTYAWSYWLRDVLAIPRVDENDPDRRKKDDGGDSWRGRSSSGDRGGSRGQPAGGRDEQPQGSTRRVVGKSDDEGKRTEAKPAAKADAPASEGKASKPDPGTPEADAHARMIDAAKAYLAACKRTDTAPQMYEIAGKAAGLKAKWNPRDTHTVAQYDAGTEALARVAAELLGEADPDVCQACNVRGGHKPGCPEAPAEREPGEDDE